MKGLNEVLYLSLTASYLYWFRFLHSKQIDNLNNERRQEREKPQSDVNISNMHNKMISAKQNLADDEVHTL